MTTRSGPVVFGRPHVNGSSCVQVADGGGARNLKESHAVGSHLELVTWDASGCISRRTIPPLSEVCMHDPGLHRVDNVLVDGGSVFLLHRPATHVWSGLLFRALSSYYHACLCAHTRRRKPSPRGRRQGGGRQRGNDKGDGDLLNVCASIPLWCPPRSDNEPV